MTKKAMILAAGYGKRLNPITLDHPKPLLKVGDQTLLSNTILFLENYGVKEIVINVHYLCDQIIDYIKKKKFNLNITLIEEKEKILNTGGGILNVLKYFNESFICINPDTIWSKSYIDELRQMEKKFDPEKNKCSMLVVDKLKSYDKNLKGDFNLVGEKITRNDKKNLKYIYTGLQIINPQVFSDIDEKVFSINKIWDRLIESNELFGIESCVNFKHVSTLEIYRSLNIK